MASQNEYGKLTPRLALQLAAPHTWPASIFPVLLAICFAAAQSVEISLLASVILLMISVLLQSAVNTINDYFDFIKGSDSAEDNVEPSDAVLVYNSINPKSARNLAIGFIVAAFILGCYCIWRAGWIPLAVALIGVIVVFLYSGGKTPISYLPIGEICSGFVMGALIAFASYIVVSREVNRLVLLWSIPMVIAIGLTMMTNNCCDIEKDKTAKRKTLPVLLGRKATRALYHACIYMWYIAILAIVAIWFTPGLLVAPFMLLATFPLARVLFKNDLKSESRISAMAQIGNMNIAMGAFYAAMVLAAAPQLTIVL